MSLVNLAPIPRGDTYNITWVFYTDATQEEESNLTGYEFFMTVNSSFSDANDDNAIIKKEPSDFTVSGGQVEVTLSSTDTAQTLGTYYYDLQFKDGDGEIGTPVRGTVQIVWDVTKRTS